MRWFLRRRDEDRSVFSRRAYVPRLDALESRQLLAVGPVKATVMPAILKATGRYVPVVVTGTIIDGLPPGRVQANFRVVDEYRRVEPQGRIAIHKIDPNTFGFTFTTYLQAKRSKSVPDGRHYYITVSAGDRDNGNGTTIAVFVPK